MRVLIVDDEPPARERLRRLAVAALRTTSKVAGEAARREQALAAVAALAPERCSWTSRCPALGGLDVAASLPEPAPAVVFVTAYDRYATRPSTPTRSTTCSSRSSPSGWRARCSACAASPGAASPGTRPRRSLPSRLLIPDRGRTHVVAGRHRVAGGRQQLRRRAPRDAIAVDAADAGRRCATSGRPSCAASRCRRRAGGGADRAGARTGDAMVVLAAVRRCRAAGSTGLRCWPGCRHRRSDGSDSPRGGRISSRRRGAAKPHCIACAACQGDSHTR